MKALDRLLGRQRPDSQSLATLLHGYRGTALLYVAAKLKIPDLLADAPRTGADLARTLGVDASSLHRVLRALAALGICAELEDGRFELAPLGGELRSDAAGGAPGGAYDLAILIGEEYAAAWSHLLQSVTTGSAGFDLAFGESPWQHRQKNLELDEHFQRWLERGAVLAGRAIAEAFDFAACRCVADLGGGRGPLLAAVLEAHPAVQGILFDHPHVISAARLRFESAGLAPRCRLIAGDLFQSIPAGADVYILKSVLHDWDDDRCDRILGNCRAAMPARQALLVVERLLPQRAADDPAIVLQDVHMLAVTGGRERTAAEYAQLFAAAGFAPPKISRLPTGHTLFEVRPET